MVTLEELRTKNFSTFKSEDASFRVTAADMKRFQTNQELPLKIYNAIDEYARLHNIKPKYAGIEELCQISETSLKKSCAGTQKITRQFLYKFTVGLKMSVDAANDLFALCGGALRDDDLEDYICLKALIDGDDILFFINQFNEFVKEIDKFQTVNKLKPLYE